MDGSDPIIRSFGARISFAASPNAADSFPQIRCISTQTTPTPVQHIAQKVSLKYTFLINKYNFLAALEFHGAQTQSEQPIQRIHTAVILAAAGHCSDKSGEVSLGNGLQKESGS